MYSERNPLIHHFTKLLGLKAKKLVVPMNIVALVHVIHACNFLDQLAYTQES